MKCNYDFGYDKCIKETKENSAHCEEHMGKKCIICKEQASKDCSVPEQFVCGLPLCGSKECNDEHYEKTHIYYI